MSIRKVKLVKGEYYHIYNRGNSKQKIFHDRSDYYHFIGLLYICNNVNKLRLFNLNRYGFELFDQKTNIIVSIASYCLMPNHFHILITQKEKEGISKFIQKLSTAYAMYYNKKYKHKGGIFEGKFKSVHIYSDKQIKYLFSYIHLNPIKLIQKDWKEKGINNKNEAVSFLNRYQYSSYLDFIGNKRIQSKILNIKDFPDYFPDKSCFKKEIFEWLSYKTE